MSESMDLDSIKASMPNIDNMDQDDSNVEEKSRNPLLNPIVMSTVAKYLPPKDLLSLRLTCQTWNEIIIPELRKRGPIVCLSSKNLCNRGWWISPSVCNSDFISTMIKSSSIPFSRYQIENISFHENSIGGFLTSCGQFMTYLKLEVERHEIHIDQFRAMIFNHLPVLRKLKVNQWSSSTLDVDNVFWRQGRLFTPNNGEFPSTLTLPNLKKIAFSVKNLRGQVTQNFLEDFFNACINLENLKVSESDTGNNNNRRYNWTTLNALKRKTANLDKLKTLELKDLKEAELQILVELSQRTSNNLRLKGFLFEHSGIEGRNAGITFAAIIRQAVLFLACQAPYLESLEISIQYEEEFSFKLPMFPNVKYFRYSTANEGKFSCFEIPSFAIHFPSLRKFLYHDYGDTISTVDFVPNGQPLNTVLPLATLKELDVDKINISCEIEEMATLFPMVSKLYLATTTLEDFNVIWSGWPQLEVVQIVKEYGLDIPNIDEVITGIPIEHHASLRQIIMANNGVDAGLRRRIILEPVKTMPGISDLKKLREFELRILPSFDDDYNEEEAMSEVTDISCYFGFSVLDQTLRVLELHGPQQISTACKEFIRTTLGPGTKIEISGY